MREAPECFRRAREWEADALFDLILRRIAWLRGRGIRQWDPAVYLKLYPLSYFEARARAGELYGLWGPDGAPRAVATLMEGDPLWSDGVAALYVHNLAGDPEVPGAGTRLLRRAMALALERGKAYLRLDCQRDNPELNAYYERLGFSYVGLGPVEEGGYRGNLRQCPLSPATPGEAV